MTIQGQMTREEFVNFQRLHMRQSRFVDFGNLLIFLLLIILFFFLIINEADPLGKWVYYCPLFFIIMIIPMINLILLPIKWNQLFTQDKEINLPYEVELGDEEIIITTELGKTARPWNHYIKWKENQNLIIFYLADNKATPFPKRVFSEKELTYIYERLRNHNIPKARPINTLTCIFFIIFGLLIIVITLALFIRLIYILIS